MDYIYEALQEKLNYDVVCIIKDFVEQKNNKHYFIRQINDEHMYLSWAYDNKHIFTEPAKINKFLLDCNNYKIILNKDLFNIT